MASQTSVTTSDSPDTVDPPSATRTDGLAGRPWSRSDFVVAGAVVLVTMVVATVFRTEIVSSDPWHYGMAAIEFPQDTWVPLGYTRYGMIIPLGPVVLAFGHAAVTFYAPAILASGVLAGSVYLLGRRWWGHIAAITAVVLLISNWIVFINLSRFYPDVPSISLVMAALVFAVAARGRQLTGGRGSDLLPVAAGFLLGWSFEARETALFAWPAVIIVLWVQGRVWRNAVLTAVPILFWAAVDVTVSAVAYGDPLLKLHTFTRQDLSTTTNPGDLAVVDQFVGLPRLDYLTLIPRLTIEREVPGGVWFLALGALAVLALFVRNTAVRLAAGSFIASYVLFVGVSGFFVPSHPAGRLDVQRYWIQFVPWIALAVAGALHVLVRGAMSHAQPPRPQLVHAFASVLLVAAPLLALVPAVSSSSLVAPNGGTPMAGISAELARRAPSKDVSVFTDWQSARILPVYQRPAFGGPQQWNATVRSITGPRQPQPGDFALLVATENSPCAFCTDALQPWRERHPTVPDTWERVYASPDDGYVLYEVR
ncbi:dolichyl-phosphate-mannose-protein mannosyltransferase [Humibacillus xanthopallidus]|uniref:Dolichyl-phosphate-mannose-protein mannosyltransferase n=1 Tax=Humibacillus xanthopallidus TaxID=412689 RepID=A0A543PX35_9MICO|nr:glycosyltransferase family 39 protein [Humibacillus xanthopallidus]TQN48647.1 dolichyl-phosphate-mannose-protein mannosyltransferase [Humibacillus xanthopallidus]